MFFTDKMHNVFEITSRNLCYVRLKYFFISLTGSKNSTFYVNTLVFCYYFKKSSKFVFFSIRMDMASFPPLDAGPSQIEVSKKLQMINHNFSSVLDLIETNAWEGYFDKDLNEITLTLVDYAIDKQNTKSDIDQEKERYVIISKLALLSEYWAEVDFAAKNQEPNGLFSPHDLSYESNIAENLSIGAKIKFYFRGLSIMFEVADVVNGKIQLKLAKGQNNKSISKKNLERIQIIVNKKPLQNGNCKFYYEIDTVPPRLDWN